MSCTNDPAWMDQNTTTVVNQDFLFLTEFFYVLSANSMRKIWREKVFALLFYTVTLDNTSHVAVILTRAKKTRFLFSFAILYFLFDRYWYHVRFWVLFSSLPVNDSIKFSRLTHRHIVQPSPMTSVILLWAFANFRELVHTVMATISIVQLVKLVAHGVALQARADELGIVIM